MVQGPMEGGKGSGFRKEAPKGGAGAAAPLGWMAEKTGKLCFLGAMKKQKPSKTREICAKFSEV